VRSAHVFAIIVGMTRSVIRSAWLVGSVFLFACGGRTLGLETEEDDTGAAGSGGSVASKGGSGGSTSGKGGSGGAGGSSTGGAGGSSGSSTGGSGGTGGTGVGAMGGTGGTGGSGGSGGTNTGKGGSNTGKGGSGGKGGGKGGKGGSNGGFKSCDQCQQAVYQQCEPIYEQCLGEKECGGLLQCFEDCGDDDFCANSCFEKYPGAEGTYYQLAGCFLCGPCEQVCDTPADFCDQVGGSGGSGSSPDDPTPQPAAGLGRHVVTPTPHAKDEEQALRAAHSRRTAT